MASSTRSYARPLLHSALQSKRANTIRLRNVKSASGDSHIACASSAPWVETALPQNFPAGGHSFASRVRQNGTGADHTCLGFAQCGPVAQKPRLCAEQTFAFCSACWRLPEPVPLFKPDLRCSTSSRVSGCADPEAQHQKFIRGLNRARTVNPHRTSVLDVSC